MKFIKNIVIALLFLIAITFSLKNNETVAIKYYFQLGPIEIPLFLLVFISLIIGIFIGGMEGLIGKMKMGSTIRKLNKELECKEKELTSLRNLPITDTDVPGKVIENEGAIQDEA
jgi:uncharacterized integral membrane protein